MATKQKKDEKLYDTIPSVVKTLPRMCTVFLAIFSVPISLLLDIVHLSDLQTCIKIQSKVAVENSASYVIKIEELEVCEVL